MNPNEFKELEQDTKYEVIKLAEDHNQSDKKLKIIDNLSKELDKLFESAKQAANNAKDNEKAQDIYRRAKEEAQKLLDRSKKALYDFKEDDRVQDTWTKISDGFDSFITELSKNDTVVSVGRKIDEVIHSDTVKDGVKTVQVVGDKVVESVKDLFKGKESGDKE